MKKILILLALIYFASCSSECANVQNPDTADQCYNAGTGEENSSCCFLRHPTENIKVCLEIPNDVNIEEFIKDKYPAYKGYDVSCFASYLKRGLLLLASLFLL